MRMTENALSRENRLAIIILAVAQSLLLLALHKAITHGAWPATDDRWLFALYTVAIGLPLFLYIAAAEWRDRANALAALALGPLLFWLGWHTGWVGGATIPGLACGTAIAIFICAFNFRAWRESGRLDYHGLLDHSWRNALTLGFLGLFLGVFALLLTLWGLLFEVIGIDFFAELFRQPEFVYPVYGLVGGWGIGLIRAHIGFIATVRHLCETLIRALLPLVALIVAAFLVTLPFTGLDKLWDTGHAAALLLWLTAVYLFFFNAVVSDEGKEPQAAWLRRILLLALVLLPVLTVLAAWSLWLRIDQYGFTVSRLWGVFVTVFLVAFSLGYAVIVARHRGLRIEALRWWNTTLGLALALALVLVHSPVVDFHRMAANDQVARLLQERTAPEDFDARYVRFELGAYGERRLEELQASGFVAERPGLQETIRDAMTATNRWSRATVADAEELRAQLQPLPGTELDDAFLEALERSSRGAHPCAPPYHMSNPSSAPCTVGDLEHQGRHYRVVMPATEYPRGSAWAQRDGAWERIGEIRRFGCTGGSADKRPLEVVDDEFFVFGDGECLYQILPAGPPVMCG